MIEDPLWQQMASKGILNDTPVHWLKTTGSTNEVAAKLAVTGAPVYTVVVAEQQTDGRGRLGKTWQSPDSTGLYISIILRPNLKPEDLPKITLAAGLAVCLAVDKITNLSTLIKWPNDILLNDKKLGGILAETVCVPGQQTAVVLGIGLNINSPETTFPAEIKTRATSLLITTGQEFPRSNLLSEIICEIRLVVARLEKSGFKNILQDWKKRDATLGRKLAWVVNTGEIIHGVSLGPDTNGQLLIKDTLGKIHEVLSGDISLAKANT